MKRVWNFLMLIAEMLAESRRARLRNRSSWYY